MPKLQRNAVDVLRFLQFHKTKLAKTYVLAVIFSNNQHNEKNKSDWKSTFEKVVFCYDSAQQDARNRSG